MDSNYSQYELSEADKYWLEKEEVLKEFLEASFTSIAENKSLGRSENLASELQVVASNNYIETSQASNDGTLFKITAHADNSKWKINYLNLIFNGI